MNTDYNYFIVNSILKYFIERKEQNWMTYRRIIICNWQLKPKSRPTNILEMIHFKVFLFSKLWHCQHIDYFIVDVHIDWWLSQNWSIFVIKSMSNIELPFCHKTHNLVTLICSICMNLLNQEYSKEAKRRLCWFINESIFD